MRCLSNTFNSSQYYPVRLQFMQNFIDLSVKVWRGHVRRPACYYGIIWSVGVVKWRPMAVLWTDRKQHIGFTAFMCVCVCVCGWTLRLAAACAPDIPRYFTQTHTRARGYCQCLEFSFFFNLHADMNGFTSSLFFSHSMIQVLKREALQVVDTQHQIYLRVKMFTWFAHASSHSSIWRRCFVV